MKVWAKLSLRKKNSTQIVINLSQKKVICIRGIQKIRSPFLPYFDHLPTSGWHVYYIGLLSNVDIWRSTYLPPLVNIVFECPLMLIFPSQRGLMIRTFTLWDNLSINIWPYSRNLSSMEYSTLTNLIHLYVL